MAQDTGMVQLVAGGQAEHEGHRPASGGGGDRGWRSGLASLAARKWSMAANAISAWHGDIIHQWVQNGQRRCDDRQAEVEKGSRKVGPQ